MERVTKLMIEQLMDCHERELQGSPPFTVVDMKFQKPLYSRGLIYAKKYQPENAKPVMAFFVTQKGKMLLDEEIKRDKNSN
ncbi:MAG: hypothetical protein ACXVNN_09935 [Bacteroidia bacterium]